MASPQKPAFSFGQPASSGPALIGQMSTTSQAPPGSGSFPSSTNLPPSSGGSGLFTSTTTSAPTGGSLFGSVASTSQASSIFGSVGTSGGTSNPFGEASKPASGGLSFGQPSGNTSSSGGGIFGSTPSSTQANQSGETATSGRFSFATPSKPADTSSSQAETPKPLFGATSNTGGGPLFNLGSNTASTTTPTSKPTNSLFANSTTPAGPPPNTSISATSSTLFSLSKPQGQESSLFGKPTPSASTAPSLLNNYPQPSNSSSITTTGTTAATPSVFDVAKGGNDLFGNKGGAQPAGGLFSNLNKPQDSSKDNKPSPFQLGGQTSASSSAALPSIAPASSAASTAPVFTFLKQSTPSSSAPTGSSSVAAPNLFSLGTQPTTSSTAAPTTGTPSTNPFALGKPQGNAATTSAPSSSAPAPTSNLFPNIGKPATTATSISASQAQESAKPSNGGAAQPTNLSASTAGPAPLAQSRLKNKSMDEIITRWATDLSKYQKEFQAQAEKVAQWDRMLVNNSEKIQKLYGQTLEAERATTEVERQLSAVENDQLELEAWLNHYEKEVDGMIKQRGDGEAATGPDAERQRTYQLAGRLSERLDEMGKDLTSMIEEINDTSSKLSKNSKQDDPLSQVVRVLNSHLTQLQQIDQGAAALTLKVQEAQKATRGLGPIDGGVGRVRGIGNANSEAADGFWRSYLGRR